MLNGFAKKEEQIQKSELTFESHQSCAQTPTPAQKLVQQVPQSKGPTQDPEELDTNTNDEEGVEDHELIDDDEPDMSIINMNKVRFEMKKLEQQKTVDSNLTTPRDSALNSKQKTFNDNPEDLSSSQLGSKKKDPIVPEINCDDHEKLKERLLCVSCMQKPKCMLIQTCKHVPFCQDCD